jgi:aldehyde:ferredoxin oxidoreductase
VEGYQGSLLDINLSENTISKVSLDDKRAKLFIGGSGYACRTLYDLLDFDAAPLSPENILFFMTGPLTGTSAPCTGRHVVCARSPLTGFWGESHAGGHFGAQLKSAGYDGIIVRGRSEKPSLIQIDNDDVQILSAEHLWGKSTDETQQIIQSDLGRVRVSSIGLAGENLVKFAGIVNEERIAARCGMGAVMGSKHLKAIAVKGSSKVPLHDSDAFESVAKESKKILGEAMSHLRDQGTSMYVDVGMMFNDMPIRYFQDIEFDADPINGAAIKSILTGRIACYSCPIGCGRRISLPDIDLVNVAGPEYQTVAGLGSNLLINDLEQISLMNNLCNKYGMDTISTGGVLAFAIRLCELGKVAWGLEWNNPTQMVRLIHDIANRRNLGDQLAEGTMRVAERYDAQEVALHVKGLEVANHDPRAFAGMATVYATASRGATHLEGDMYSVDMGADVRELGIVGGDRLENDEKGIIAAKAQDFRAFFDTVIMCHFAIVPPKSIIELLNLATGEVRTSDDILLSGARSVTMKRMFNLRCGLRPEDDSLPAVFLSPLPDYATDDFAPDIEKQLDDYYKYRVWSRSTGKPSEKALKKLEIDV